jgi:ATP-dependent helicase/nuclease subunit B
MLVHRHVSACCGRAEITETHPREPGPQAGNLFTIAPTLPFLDTLVDSLADGHLVEGFRMADDPVSFSKATIFVPNRRSARALSSAFLARLEGTGAVLLPRIRTLGDVSDEEFGLGPDAAELGVLREAIEPGARKLELAHLIHIWVDTMEQNVRDMYGDEDIVIPSSRADALRLADDLSVLMNQISQEETDWADIEAIVPENHANWWQLTSQFLKIIASAWPARLEELQLLDPAMRSAELLHSRAKQYEEGRVSGPVIIAGSTGSVPSTQRLLKAVSRLPQGAVVLPGLDRELPDEEWQILCHTNPANDPAIETHPQFGLARLLTALQVDRESVTELVSTTSAEHARTETCRKLVSVALASSDATADWIEHAGKFDPEILANSLSHVSVIEAGTERSEALAIAIAMREVLETPNKSAALVTPDRNLARRVSSELRRFRIDVDDSGGTPLANSNPAVFLQLIADCCFSQTSNATLASLLKHPFCLMGLEREKALELGQAFELAALRGAIRPARPGSLKDDLLRRRQEFDQDFHVPRAIRRLDEVLWNTLFDQFERLDATLEPLLALRTSLEPISISALMQVIKTVMTELSQGPDGTGYLFDNETGEALEKLLNDFITAGDRPFRIEWMDIPAIIKALLAGTNTRPRHNRHPRLHIYGPLEIRLLEHDRIILGGLNEGTWPASVRNDPFLNRSMRHELGMASPERRVGLAAHDFQQLMGKQEILLSRSSRVDKSPTVASRWLQRLGALVGKEQYDHLVARGQTYLRLAEVLDHTSEPIRRISPPAPTPPVSSRPVSLPVTAIETWIRDPYALYANRILKLEPVAPLEREPDPLLKGTLYHRIMQDYIGSNPERRSPEDRHELLDAIAEETIRAENLPEEITRTWIFRFREVAHSYIAWEAGYLQEKPGTDTFCELSGRIRLFDAQFELTARADRIDYSADGLALLMDYKTGTGPSAQQARTLSPQLALEGLILSKGGFEGLPPTLPQDLLHIRLLSGNRFRDESITSKDMSPEAIINNAASGLEDLFHAFRNEEQAYVSRRVPFRDGDISGDYDHLARVREWSTGGEEDGDG